MITLPCSGCNTHVIPSDLSQADDGGDGSTSPALCLVCVWPDYYTYDGGEQNGRS